MTASSVDTAGLDRLLAGLQRQVPFAIATTLTGLAKTGQEAGRARIVAAFDTPTPFTRSAVAITPARKERLVAAVFVKDVQAGYLAIEETGGVRVPRRGAPIVLPADIRVNQYGNIPRGALRRERAKRSTFTVGRDDPANARRAKPLLPGIYQRKGGRIRPLAILRPRARYAPRFRFRATVTKAATAALPRLWSDALAKAIRSARVR